MTNVIAWQKLEGAIAMISALALIAMLGTDLAWWALLLLFFAPDLSFVGYMLGNRIGAFAYNAVHIYGFGLAVGIIGMARESAILIDLGLLWFAHSGFDRLLGYGLKTESGFKDTHLGQIGPS